MIKINYLVLSIVLCAASFIITAHSEWHARDVRRLINIGNRVELERALTANPEWVNGKFGEYNETALIMAVEYNTKDIVALLLKLGANVDGKDLFDQTALYRAVSEGNKDIVDLLLEENPDINAQNKSGWTPLHLAAAYHNNLVEPLLRKNPDVNMPDDGGNTPLHVAASNNKEQAVVLLLARSDINLALENKEHKTAAQVAQEKGHKDIAELINARVFIDKR